MPKGIQLDPPICVRERSGATFTLSSIDALIDYVRRTDTGENSWKALRHAAFIAAAVPSPENVDALRHAAADAFEVRD